MPPKQTECSNYEEKGQHYVFYRYWHVCTQPRWRPERLHYCGDLSPSTYPSWRETVSVRCSAAVCLAVILEPQYFFSKLCRVEGLPTVYPGVAGVSSQGLTQREEGMSREKKLPMADDIHPRQDRTLARSRGHTCCIRETRTKTARGVKRCSATYIHKSLGCFFCLF